MEVAAIPCEPRLTNRTPFPFPLRPLDRAAALSSPRPIDEQVVALPAGLVTAVCVDQEQHPGIACRRRQRLTGRHAKRNMLRVASNLGEHQIVAAGRVRVLHMAVVARPIAVNRVTGIVAIDRLDTLPLGEAAIDHNTPRGAHSWRRPHALVATDKTRKLVVIGIGMAAFHRLDVAAVLVVKLIDKHHRLLHPVELMVQPSNPLVPAGHKDQPRIFRQRSLKLLGEVEPMCDDPRPQIGRSVVETPAASPRLTHRS